VTPTWASSTTSTIYFWFCIIVQECRTRKKKQGSKPVSISQQGSYQKTLKKPKKGKVRQGSEKILERNSNNKNHAKKVKSV